MVENEIFEVLDEIQRFYGKEFNREQLKQIQKYFENLNVKRFRYLVSIVYSKCKYLPSLAEMVEIHNEIPYNEIKLDNEAQTQRYSNCEYCGNTGFITYKRTIKGNEYEFVASCKCARGQNYNFDGANIKDDRAKSDYYIPKADDLMKLQPQKHYGPEIVERAKKYIAERFKK